MSLNKYQSLVQLEERFYEEIGVQASNDCENLQA